MIMLENWITNQYGDAEASGRWIFDRFYGPICEIDVQEFENERIEIKIRHVYVEGQNNTGDFKMVCSLAKEFLETYSEVSVLLSRIERICNFNRNEDVEETLMQLLKQSALI